MSSDERRMGPIQEARWKAVVLGGNENFPNSFLGGEKGAPKSNKVAEEMLLEMNLAVRRIGPAEPVQSGKELEFVIGNAPEDRILTKAPAGAVGLDRSGPVEQFAERLDDNSLDPHTQ